MSDIIIKAENIGKMYTIGHQGERARYTALRDVLIQNARNIWNKTKDLATGKPIIQGDTKEEFWALKDLNFEICQGEAVGIIGRNGAGKSTILKILSRITEPSTGRVTIKGRVASLLEVGTGFHPELTGRENIYLNGTILGMTREEIKRKFDEIVAFAEVERYLDTPVKRYSSGMYVRLAFAVAAHLEPEIMVVDEVLAVGDAAFQKKCLGKMGGVAKEGRTVIFVSHNMGAIMELCQRCMWIDAGEIVAQGDSHDIVVSYLDSGCNKRTDGILTSDMHDTFTGHLYFCRIMLLGEDEKPCNSLFLDSRLRINFEFEVLRPLQETRIMVGIRRFDGTLISAFHDYDYNRDNVFTLKPGRYSVSMEADLPLMPGGYSIELGAKPLPGYWGFGNAYAWALDALNFTVVGTTSDSNSIFGDYGVVRPRSKWSISTTYSQA